MRDNQGTVAFAFPVEKPKHKRKIQTRSKKRLHLELPVGEKLLYLFSVIVCVLLATVVVTNYAKVTELNVSIQQVNTEIQKTKEVNIQLDSKKKDLGSVERVRKFADDHGLKMKSSKTLPSLQP